MNKKTIVFVKISKKCQIVYLGYVVALAEKRLFKRLTTRHYEASSYSRNQPLAG